jgi:hypothetical protein
VYVASISAAQSITGSASIASRKLLWFQLLSDLYSVADKFGKHIPLNGSFRRIITTLDNVIQSLAPKPTYLIVVL